MVLNPAVEPARDLVHYVGDQTAYHDPATHFAFKAEYIDELRALTPSRLAQPDRYAAVIAKGDELLDWREMSQRYAGAHIKLARRQRPRVVGFRTRTLISLLEFLDLLPSRG